MPIFVAGCQTACACGGEAVALGKCATHITAPELMAEVERLGAELVTSLEEARELRDQVKEREASLAQQMGRSRAMSEQQKAAEPRVTFFVGMKLRWSEDGAIGEVTSIVADEVESTWLCDNPPARHHLNIAGWMEKIRSGKATVEPTPGMRVARTAEGGVVRGTSRHGVRVNWEAAGTREVCHPHEVWHAQIRTGAWAILPPEHAEQQSAPATVSEDVDVATALRELADYPRDLTPQNFRPIARRGAARIAELERHLADARADRDQAGLLANDLVARAEKRAGLAESERDTALALAAQRTTKLVDAEDERDAAKATAARLLAERDAAVARAEAAEAEIQRARATVEHGLGAMPALLPIQRISMQAGKPWAYVDRTKDGDWIAWNDSVLGRGTFLDALRAACAHVGRPLPGAGIAPAARSRIAVAMDELEAAARCAHGGE